MYATTYRRTFDDLPVDLKKEIVDITAALFHLQIEERTKKQSLRRTRLVAPVHQQEKKETILRKLCRNTVRKVQKQDSQGPMILRYGK